MFHKCGDLQLSLQRLIVHYLNNSIFDQLAERGFAVVDRAFPQTTYKELVAFLDRQIEEDQLRQAGIGSLSQFEVNKGIRGDEIQWLKRGETNNAIVEFYRFADELIQNLNRELFLSLCDGEFHFAHYPSGTFYHRHLDQFKGRNNRQISLVLYMNDNWKPGDGGELKIFGEHRDEIIAPIGNRLVLFRSDTIEHEVLETTTSRKSLTGWLLNQPVGLGFLG